jgi:hypothetical protein
VVEAGSPFERAQRVQQACILLSKGTTAKNLHSRVWSMGGSSAWLLCDKCPQGLKKLKSATSTDGGLGLSRYGPCGPTRYICCVVFHGMHFARWWFAADRQLELHDVERRWVGVTAYVCVTRVCCGHLACCSLMVLFQLEPAVIRSACT